LHPYFLRFKEFLLRNNYDREEALYFLKMVKLKEKRLEWALKQKEKGKLNKDLIPYLGIKLRRFQQICAEYRQTGEVPKLNKQRRPKTFLSEEQKELIRKAADESKIEGALALRLHVQKYYKELIPRNKLHAFLLEEGISKEDPKKKKQRKYCRYERNHSFSLVHLDWHESKVIPDKQVCVVEDDASRLIICGDEFDDSKAEKNIALTKEAIKIAYEQYSATIREVNTDKGSQFYSSKVNKHGEKALCEYEKFLEKQGITHFPSRRNHPQTNGKEERWFRTYEENRGKFKSFKEFVDWYNNRIHLGLSRTEGITPNERVVEKLQPSSLLGLFCRRWN
jgi:putative transposase